MRQQIELFMTFFKIGAFTLGGGYAMLPLIQKEIVVNKKWLEEEEVLTMLAVAQSAPGAIAVNASVIVGKRVSGYVGAIVALFGTILPSFLIILAVATLFTGVQDNAWVQSFFQGIRPAVVALIMLPVVQMYRTLPKTWLILSLPLVVALLVLNGISPIVIICVTIICQILYTYYTGYGREQAS